MKPALARSIAETAAEILGRRSDKHGGVAVSDEAIGAHLWFERGFRDHDDLVALINWTRTLLDQRASSRSPTDRKPTQLSFDLEAAL